MSAFGARGLQVMRWPFASLTAHAPSARLTDKLVIQGKHGDHPREHYFPPLHRERDPGGGSLRPWPISMQGELSGSSRRTGKERRGWHAARWREPNPSPTFRTPAFRPSGRLSKQARPEPHFLQRTRGEGCGYAEPSLVMVNFRDMTPRLEPKGGNLIDRPVARAAHTPGPVFRVAFLPEVRRNPSARILLRFPAKGRAVTTSFVILKV